MSDFPIYIFSEDKDTEYLTLNEALGFWRQEQTINDMQWLYLYGLGYGDGDIQNLLQQFANGTTDYVVSYTYKFHNGSIERGGTSPTLIGVGSHTKYYTPALSSSTNSLTSSSGTEFYDYKLTGDNDSGLLIEPARSNKILYSTDFTQTQWKGTFSIVSSVQTDPLGTSTATLLDCSGGNTLRYTDTSFATVDNSRVSFSAFFKNPAGFDDGATIEIQTGTQSPSVTFYRATHDLYSGKFIDYVLNQQDVEGYNIVTRVIPYRGGWWRFEQTFDVRLSTNSHRLRIRDSSGQFLTWGWQAEEGETATTYIPTSGSIVDRTVDTFTFNGIPNSQYRCVYILQSGDIDTVIGTSNGSGLFTLPPPVKWNKAIHAAFIVGPL